MDKKFLFVMDKLCDGKPELGWSNNFHNIIATFRQSCPDWQYDSIFIDEAVNTYNSHIDAVLIPYIKKHGIDKIIFCLMAGSPFNPSLETYRELKQMGVWLGFFYPDTGWGWPLDSISKLQNIGDLFVSWDNPKSEIHTEYNKVKSPKHIYLWPPQDKTLYYHDENETKDIDVSFIGSYAGYRDREQTLFFLKERFPQLVIAGGQRREKLSPERYASIIRRSKMTINFPLSQAGVFYQSKSRIFEAAACKTAILDFKNPSSELFFNSIADYIEYNSIEDLMGKIEYYLSGPSERNQRMGKALNSYEKYNRNYTAKHYWDIILSKINETKHNSP